MSSNFTSVLEAARAGGEWAWGEIYRELAPSVRGYVRSRGAPEPDDLTGEVFLQVVRDLPRFAGDEPAFRSWVFTIAHHRLLDDARRRQRRPVEPASTEVLSAALPAGGAGREATERLEDDRVRSILGRLSPDQQNVLFLRIFGDLTVEDVAGLLGKRPGAVKALQRRGLAAIRRELEREGEREGVPLCTPSAL